MELRYTHAGELIVRVSLVLIISNIIVYRFFVTSPAQLAPQFQTAGQAAELKRACTQSNGANEPAEIKEPREAPQAVKSDWSTDCPIVAGLIKELEKANTEIQSRLDREGQWFYLKYLFTGALTAAFLLQVFFRHEDGKADTPELRLDALAKSPAVAFVLALATVIAISVDLQILSGRMIIEQLGLWIKYNVEPALLKNPAGASDWVVTGWEHFLWDNDSAYHTSLLYAHTFWPNIFHIAFLPIRIFHIRCYALAGRPGDSRW